MAQKDSPKSKRSIRSKSAKSFRIKVEESTHKKTPEI